MNDKICELVPADGGWVQRTRDATPEEQAEINARRAGAAVTAKLQAWDAIKAERDRRKAGGVLVAGSWFHSDTDSRVQWLGLKDTARDMLFAGATPADPVVLLGQAVHWKTMTGAFVPVTVQLAIDVGQATKELDARLFARAEQHRAAMEASTDSAAYDFSGGWPPTFGE